MNLICFPLMHTSSKRLMQKRFKKKSKFSDRTYHYRPKQMLIKRLAAELDITEMEVRKQIRKERLWLLQDIYGNDVSVGDI